MNKPKKPAGTKASPQPMVANVVILVALLFSNKPSAALLTDSIYTNISECYFGTTNVYHAVAFNCGHKFLG